MRMNVSQQDSKAPAASKPARSCPPPAARTAEPPGLAASLLNLQRRHGNRYVQQMLARANGTGDEAVAEADDTSQQAREAGLVENGRTSGRAEQVFGSPRTGEAVQAKPKVVRVELQPHSAPDAALRALAPIYKEGKTPFFNVNGSVGTLDIAPAHAATTGHHLETMRQRFGEKGLAQAVHGLTLTRGANFAASALRHAPTAQRLITPHVAKAANVGVGETDEALLAVRASADSTTQPRSGGKSRERTAGGGVATALSHAGAGQRLPEGVRRKLAILTGDHLGDVRVHNDCAADNAARLLGARAFTIGRSIYFAAGEFRPSSAESIRVLAHEVAHAVQQRGATMPQLQSLPVSEASDSEETEAEQFADAATCPQASPLSLAPRQVVTAVRIQRAISFAHGSDTFTKNTMGITESAAGFQIRPDAFPLFEWNTDITISGNAGDPFGDFEVGPHQVVRSFQNNVYWGAGANRTRRLVTCSSFPIRDATAAGNTWYADSLASAAFGASGDVRHTRIEDSPQSPLHPWANPVPGRGGNTGSFNYGAAFVAYISARDTTAGTGAAAFRAIGNVYWNVPISGTFDTTNPVGTRVTASGGTVNRSGIISGASGEFPSMHGGATGNDSVTSTDT